MLLFRYWKLDMSKSELFLCFPFLHFSIIMPSLQNTEFSLLSLVTTKSKLKWLGVIFACWPQPSSGIPIILWLSGGGEGCSLFSQQTPILVWTWILSWDVEFSPPLLTGMWIREPASQSPLGYSPDTFLSPPSTCAFLSGFLLFCSETLY